ncbi:MAG: 23S rRNA (pseudouridine(1915)-N(3))-methyltransferase RlmH [Clostridia bacterium]|nr:23S rRNA (pseudouridine(1915)-N(3))-methyltransferase RlmH [Clostridia bacterium]
MLKIKIITVGALSERYWKDAVEEYKKRISAFASVEEICLKEARLPSSPSDAEIARALDAEGEAILAAIPKRALVMPLCIEGRQLSSEELASKLDGASSSGISTVCFIIGSSFGLSASVKSAGTLLSFSRVTFPHQLARVMLYEAVYRALSITAGTKYHK